MKRRSLISIYSISSRAFLALAAGCGSSESSKATLEGNAAKGPLVSGSQVTCSQVDASGNATGTLARSDIINDEGRYSLAFDYEGAVSLTASGSYYNEITGEVSSAPVTLNALASTDARATQEAHINVITHLAYDRAKALMAEGKSAAEAVVQAEGELRAGLGLGGESFNPNANGIEMDILGGDSDASAYVFAASSIFANAAQQASSAAEMEANLEDLMTSIAADLAADGTISMETLLLLEAAEQNVEPDEVMGLLAARLTEIGSKAQVPNINRVLDSDLDGIVNAGDNCPLIANTSQEVMSGICAYQKVVYAAGTETSFQGDSSLLITADIDGDGSVDVAYLDHDHSGGAQNAVLEVWLNDGSGNLGAAVSNKLDSAFAAGASFSPESIHAADINADGALDIVLGMSAEDVLQGSVVYLPGDGVGHFEAALDCVDQVNLEGGALIVDVNADGNADILTASHTDTVTRLTVAFGQQAGGFAIPDFVDVLDGLSTAFTITGFASGHVDGDGSVDIVVTGISEDLTGNHESLLYVFLNDGSDGFTSSKVNMNIDAAASFSSAGDVDGDGKLDIVVAIEQSASHDATVQVLFGDGTGAFGNAHTTSFTTQLLAGEQSPALGDFNGDGKIDVSIGSSVLLSSGLALDVGMALRTGVDATGEINNVKATADLNGDGTADLVKLNTTSSAGAVLTVLMNPADYRSW